MFPVAASSSAAGAFRPALPFSSIPATAIVPAALQPARPEQAAIEQPRISSALVSTAGAQLSRTPPRTAPASEPNPWLLRRGFEVHSTYTALRGFRRTARRRFDRCLTLCEARRPTRHGLQSLTEDDFNP